ncbi:glycosyltransferase family 2 protein [Mucilaginibacter mali]|uniref:Glycosyltransferase family 2 protein n=1 Tax=Mucilaginibacter mali TaxID=2740462 RepID=A0A7D4UKC8_9SPHI|nr:glycosyltransferase family 2 protein [Mucilaginibacter mali]QKJ30442.1 glycosyltransferase family 2 protein [Mucilaginibacter mali]
MDRDIFGRESLMDTPLVSIIIPLYNAEQYIAEAIRSALDQTWPNKEIIIVDDGSTDRSVDIIQKFDNEIIKIYKQRNSGAAAARNFGLKQSVGQYIQFLDADDIISPDKIESQMALIGNSNHYLGLCGTVHFHDGTDHLSYPLEHEWVSAGTDDPADFLIKLYSGKLYGPQYGGMIQPNAWLTPRLLIDKAGLWNPMRSPDDDGEFFCRMVLASKGIRYTRKGINYYRKFTSSNSLSAQKHYDAIKAVWQSNLLKAQHLLSATTDERAKPAIARLFLEYAFSFYPYYKSLYKEAQENAWLLAPNMKFNPYHHGLNKKMAEIIGWKSVKYMQYIKHKFKL